MTQITTASHTEAVVEKIVLSKELQLPYFTFYRSEVVIASEIGVIAAITGD